MFAELVCGPPGSGKTTYCEGKRQLLTVYDPSRPVVVFNMDPANDGIFPYPCDVNICELIAHADAVAEHHLGPNGAYLYCSDYIGENLDWVQGELERLVAQRVAEAAEQFPTSEGYPARAPYLLIDCPGQVEFYLNSDCMQRFVTLLQKKLLCSVCMVHLADAGVAARDMPTYAATCLLSLSTMVDLELPQVNVLNKWDTVLDAMQGNAAPRGRQHTAEGADRDLGRVDDDEALDMLLAPNELFRENLGRMWLRTDTRKLRDEECAPGRERDDESPAQPDYRQSRLFRLTEATLGVVEGFGMVGFEPLAVTDQRLMVQLTQKIDNAMGNLF